MLSGYKLTELVRDLTPTQQRWVAFCFIKEQEARSGKSSHNQRVDASDFMRKVRESYEFEKRLNDGKYDNLFLKESKFKKSKILKEY